MIRFFERSTKTLFITKGQTPAKDLSENSLIELSEEKSPKLCRTKGGMPRQFVDIESAELKSYYGYFDKNNDDKNKNIEEVIHTIYCP